MLRMIKRLSLMLLLALTQCLGGCSHDEQASSKPLPGFVAREGDALVITQGDMHLTLLPQIAARVRSLTVGDREMMYQAGKQAVQRARQSNKWNTLFYQSQRYYLSGQHGFSQ